MRRLLSSEATTTTNGPVLSLASKSTMSQRETVAAATAAETETTLVAAERVLEAVDAISTATDSHQTLDAANAVAAAVSALTLVEQATSNTTDVIEGETCDILHEALRNLAAAEAGGEDELFEKQSLEIVGDYAGLTMKDALLRLRNEKDKAAELILRHLDQGNEWSAEVRELYFESLEKNKGKTRLHSTKPITTQFPFSRT